MSIREKNILASFTTQWRHEGMKVAF